MLAVAIVSIIAACAAHPATAAQSDFIRWFVGLDDAEGAQAPRTFRIYELPERLSLRLTIANESADPVLVDLGTLAERLQVTARRDNVTIPILIEWQSEIAESGVRRWVGLAETLRIEARKGIELQLLVRPSHAQGFGDGQHTLEVLLESASGAFRAMSGDQWPGRFVRGTSLTLLIADPVSPREQSSAHRLAAARALSEGRSNDNLRSLELARAADPSDVLAMIALGQTYIRLKRYRDAIPVLELAIRGMPRERSPVPYQLALAYVASGDEASAISTLRAGGVSPDRLQSEMAMLRRRAAAQSQR